jgi:feruloyl esterase
VGAEVAGPNGQSGWIGQAVHAENVQRRLDFVWIQFPSLHGVVGEKREWRDGRGPRVQPVDIDKDPPRLEELRQILDSTDPDLSAFRKHGGKLVMCFGWADPQLNARMGVEYYEQVVDKMGSSTDEFFRLFMVRECFIAAEAWGPASST